MFRNVLSKITIIDEIDKRSIGKKNAYLVRYSYGNICVATLAEKKKKKISQFFATFPKRKKKKKGKMINLVGATHRDVASYCYVNFFFTLLHSGNAFPLPPRSTPKIRFSRDLEK